MLAVILVGLALGFVVGTGVVVGRLMSAGAVLSEGWLRRRGHRKAVVVKSHSSSDGTALSGSFCAEYLAAVTA